MNTSHLILPSFRVVVVLFATALAWPVPYAFGDSTEETVVATESEADEVTSAIAKPVSGEPVQVFGWREYVKIGGVKTPMHAKLDTGARTSSIHAEKIEMFERDGKKWVRFIVADPQAEKPVYTKIEAPLSRIAKIKEPGGESTSRKVVLLGLQIGERKLRSEFTLNNRNNMLAPVLIGRTLLKELGWVDSSRTYIADQKVFR